MQGFTVHYIIFLRCVLDYSAPIGWHIPQDSDWTILVDFLGGTEKAGGKLKDYYTPYWSEPNVCLANNYGFFSLARGRKLSYLVDLRKSGNEVIGGQVL